MTEYCKFSRKNNVCDERHNLKLCLLFLSNNKKTYTFSFLKTNNKSLNQNYHNFNDFLECKVGYNYFSPTVSKMKLKDKETINYTHQIKKLI